MLSPHSGKTACSATTADANAQLAGVAEASSVISANISGNFTAAAAKLSTSITDSEGRLLRLFRPSMDFGHKHFSFACPMPLPACQQIAVQALHLVS
jgi:hypothetical protein